MSISEDNAMTLVDKKRISFVKLLDALVTVDEYAQMGLNSDNPDHWEAALQDILDVVRNLNIENED